MIYYSTGKSSYLKKVGTAVEETNLTTAQILIKKGHIVESLEQLKPQKEEVVEVVETIEQPVEKVIKVEKPKGRPKGKVTVKRQVRK